MVLLKKYYAQTSALAICTSSQPRVLTTRDIAIIKIQPLHIDVSLCGEHKEYREVNEKTWNDRQIQRETV